MGRLDYKLGRFSPDAETNEIEEGLRGYQVKYGDSIDYYRFMREASTMHDIYDEGTNGGRVYNGPIDLPCLQVIHEEGGNEDTDIGFYYNDDLHATLPFKTFARAGFPHPDLTTADYLKDRIVYDGKVFRVLKINVLGQIQRRDVVVSIEATQVRGDELVNDSQFAQWSD
jgi:hypothetical protein